MTLRLCYLKPSGRGTACIRTDPEDEGTMCLRNIRNYPLYTGCYYSEYHSVNLNHRGNCSKVC